MKRIAQALLASVVVAFALLLGLGGFGVAAAAHTADPGDHAVHTSELAETGAGDRALIALGVVGGILLVGGAAATAITARRDAERR